MEIETARPGGSFRSGTGAQAIALITELERTGNGWRCGLLGNTGTGKTTAARALLRHRAGQQLTLIHDDSKAHPEYPGVPYVLKLHQAPAGAAVVGFRGDPYAGTRVDVDDVAGLAVELARARIPVRLVVDELNKAVSDGGKSLTAPQLSEAMTAGRTMGLSVVWGTQSPTRIPTVVLDQSSAIMLFQLGPRALNYLDERLGMDPEMLAVVPTLHAHPHPDAGDFVLHRPGYPWDRTIYRFGPGEL